MATARPSTRTRSPRKPARPAATLLAITALGVAYGLLFPDRSDYLGHFLAGAGGTLLLLAVVVATAPGSAKPVLVTVGIAIFLGVLTEATIFRLAEFDPVDLASQSLGAVLAGIALIDAENRPASTGLAALGGFVLLIAGFNYAFA